MLPLYLFSVLVGGALLAVSMMGSDHIDGDIDMGHHGQNSDNAAQFLSMRTLTYFLFVFGGVGTALSILSKSTGWFGILATAALSGLGVAALVAATFRYLSRTESGGSQSDDSFVGLSGRIVLPIAHGGLGKVMVHRGDRTYELLARPLDPASGDPASWTSVVIVEMSRGTALIAPLDEPTLQLDP